tara:strand:- start:670 stop:984 length:315 start_codon:yes stop_codon:yes gene_type:complete
MSDPAGYELKAQQVVEKHKLLAQLKTRTAYRRLFMKDGELTEAAELVLGDLLKAARFGKDNPLATNEELRERAAMRRLMLHLFARLDPTAMVTLSDKLNGRNER